MFFKFKFFSRIYVVDCPDGSDRRVYKNIDDIFPLAISDSNKKFDADFKLPETLDTKLSAEISAAIKNVVFNVDGNNSSLVLLQRAAYSVYTTNPCSQSVWYQGRIDDLSNRLHKMQEQERLVDALLTLARIPDTEPDQLFAILGQLVEKMSNEDAALLTVDAMDQSERTAHEMTRENDGDS